MYCLGVGVYSVVSVVDKIIFKLQILDQLPRLKLYISKAIVPDSFRFGCDERKNVSLFTINVPAKFNRKTPTPSYLVKWDCSKWLPQMSQSAGFEPLTQMAVRFVLSSITKNAL